MKVRAELSVQSVREAISKLRKHNVDMSVWCRVSVCRLTTDPYIPSPPTGSEPQGVLKAHKSYKPPPTPHPSAISVLPLEHDDGSLVPTRSNTPAPIKTAILSDEGITSHLAKDTGSAIKRLDTEHVEVSSHRRVSKIHRRVYRPDLGCYEENLDTSPLSAFTSIDIDPRGSENPRRTKCVSDCL
ncbi:hypothetical protein BD309DRAFT_377738 [Dichomitus squalens]|uniref:Uncharacterized protein n=1 Tax=Dichomitus squalens TaxID=114155 RepID=A0A4Q9NFR9_9APHY|nr:hypothetical protein BD309DRAFT_377738 [Dichomitus squalens]TBU53367.1 hypothetical protein BD310DRAFT_160306 [Dichomitus squalens]